MLENIKQLTLILAIALTVVAPNLLYAANKPPGKIVWQIEQQFVSVVPQDNSAAPQNDHPATVAADTLAEMLYVVSVNEKKSRFSFGGKKADIGSPLFSEYEVDVLSRVFADALTSASPQQDILFRIHGGKEQLGGITSRKTINTGRAFWRDNSLHIIFGEVHKGDKTKWLYGQKQEDKYKRKFGSRTSASDRVDVAFASVPGITQYKDNDGKVRTDWITIDPDVVLGKINATEQPATSSQPTTTSTNTAASANTAAPANTNQQLPLKQRLTELKQLREEGLISEEIYQQKVKELVDDSY